MRWIIWPLGILFVVLATAALVLANLDWNKVRPFLAHETKKRLGRELRVAGDLEVKIFSLCPSVKANDVSLENAVWAKEPAMAEAKQFGAGFCLVPLLFKRELFLTHLHLRDGAIRLEKNAAGVWNYSMGRSEPGHEAASDESAESRASAGLPEWRGIDLANVTVDIKSDPRERPVVLDIRRFGSQRPTENGPLTVEGNGEIQGVPFGLDASFQVPEDLNAASEITADARGFLGEVKVVAHGTVGDLGALSPVIADVDVDGRNLASLLGELGLPLSADVPPLSASGKVERRGSVYDVRDLALTFGGSDVGGNLHADLRDRSWFKIDLRSQVLRWIDVAPMLPKAAARELPAERVARAERSGKERKDAKIFSPKPLSFAALKEFDFDVNVAINRFEGRGKAELIEKAAIVAKLKDGALRVDPAKVVFAGADAKLDLSLNAAKRPATLDLDFTTKNLPLQKALASYLPNKKIGKLKLDDVLSGNASSSLKVTATGDSVSRLLGSLNGTWGLVVEEGKVSSLVVEALGLDLTEAIGTLMANKQTLNLDCMIVELHAKDGVVTPSPFLVGTPDSNIVLTGDVDLSQERLNLTIETKPKDFSIGALNVPIDIKGTFASPEVSLRKRDVAARVAAAVGLGFVVGPLAAVLPFTETGSEKAGRCSQYVATLRKIESQATSH